MAINYAKFMALTSGFRITSSNGPLDGRSVVELDEQIKYVFNNIFFICFGGIGSYMLDTFFIKYADGTLEAFQRCIVRVVVSRKQHIKSGVFNSVGYRIGTVKSGISAVRRSAFGSSEGGFKICNGIIGF